MFGKSKVTQSMIDAVKQVVETAPIKEPTPTGMRVYGGSYGNSAKAKQDQTKSSVDTLKGPKDKEMKEELKGNQDKIDANHNGKIDAQDFAILRGKKKVKEGREFTEKLLSSINEKKDVVMPEDATPAKNTDIADKSYLKDMGKKPTVKSDLKNLGRFLTGKKETNEEASNKKPDWLLAAELKAEKKEGKLKKEEVETIEERDEGKHNNGKTTGFKVVAAKAAKEYGSKAAGNRVAGAIRAKILAKEEVTEQELDEELNEVLSKDASAGDWIHDFVHSDNPKFAGKSKAERKKMALGAYYGQHKEEAEITTDTLAGRTEGGKSDDYKRYKVKLKGDIESKAPEAEKPESTPARASIHAEATIAGTPGWEKIKNADEKGNIKDKSGATHTPMSRAKDLARQAFKKIKNETMMGKISN